MSMPVRRLALGFFAAAMLLAGWVGCDLFKQNANEGDALLGVAVEGPVAERMEPRLRSALTRILHTPQAEQRFYLTFVAESELADVNRWQQVLLVGTLDGNDQISARVKRMLPDELKQAVRQGERRMFSQQDLWVRGQTVIVLVAPTLEELEHYLLERGDEVYRAFASDRRARMKKHLYSRLEQEEVADSLTRAHGWHLRIPHDYALAGASRAPNYVRLRRLYPDRFLTVAWRISDGDSLSLETLLAWRDELGRTYPDTARTTTVELDTQWVELGGRTALAAHGLWETVGPLGGGPFVSYLLQQGGTIYLLDGKVFAPDRAKEPYIRQLEVILNTFDPTGDGE